jgi:hypothetical protein
MTAAEIFMTGDLVEITCHGAVVPGVVVLASDNGRSLMLAFEAILDGHVGMMPVLLDDAGALRSIANGVAVTLAPLPAPVTLAEHTWQAAWLEALMAAYRRLRDKSTGPAAEAGPTPS